MKITQILPDSKAKFSDDACRDYGIAITDLTAGELDSFRCLLQSLFKYGQMPVTSANLEELSLNSLMKRIGEVQ